MSALLLLESVACLRGGRLLFERLDLALEPGAAAIVTGANGAGKSSLLRIAAGLLRPSAGTAKHERAALADERAALDERRTLGSALCFWAAIGGTDPKAGIRAMGLTSLERVPVRVLSTGQRKRASLARVVSSGAPLWLLDEPTNGLDEEGRALLAAAMSEHRASGGAILAATHQSLRLDGAQVLAL